MAVLDATSNVILVMYPTTQRESKHFVFCGIVDNDRRERVLTTGTIDYCIDYINNNGYKLINGAEILSHLNKCVTFVPF